MIDGNMSQTRKKSDLDSLKLHGRNSLAVDMMSFVTFKSELGIHEQGSDFIRQLLIICDQVKYDFFQMKQKMTPELKEKIKF